MLYTYTIMMTSLKAKRQQEFNLALSDRLNVGRIILEYVKVRSRNLKFSNDISLDM